MMRRPFRPVRRAGTTAAVVGACAVLTLVGCSSQPLDGTLNITGSATMLPLMSEVIGDFTAEHPLVTAKVDLAGTSSGMLLFCEGLANIAAASRPMSEREATDCQAAGIEYAQLLIARDAVVAFTKASANEPTCLTFDDLYALTGPESGGFVTWEDAQPLARELGSSTEFPDKPLNVIAPDAENGTRGLFLTEVIEPIAEGRGTVTALAPTSYEAPGQAALISAVIRSEAPLAFVGYARLAPYDNQIQRFEVDAGDGCVAPTPETIDDGTYPLARPLYVYVNTKAAAADPTVAAFVENLTSDRVMGDVAARQALSLDEGDRAAAREQFAAQLGSGGAQ